MLLLPLLDNTGLLLVLNTMRGVTVFFENKGCYSAGLHSLQPWFDNRL